MILKQIRNATLILQYASTTFLIDPALAPKGTYPSFPNSIRPDARNPLVELPVSMNEILSVDAILITHLHLDHFDDTAKKMIPSNKKIFVQNTNDADSLRNDGFSNVEILTDSTHYNGIRLRKTVGQHGRGDVLSVTGTVCGILFQHPQEKTLYIAGDTIWYDGVNNTIQQYQPDVIVTNNGANSFLNSTPIIMNDQDLLQVHLAAPHALLIASHMEAYNHWTLSRAQLKEYAMQHNFMNYLRIPVDGESYFIPLHS